MDDKELDNILDEIKKHSDDVNPEDALPSAAQPEEPAEEAPAEETPAEETPKIEEPAAEEAPVAEEPEAEEAPVEETEEAPAEEALEEVPAEEAADGEETPAEEAEEAAEDGETDLLALAEDADGEEKPGIDPKKKKIIIAVAAIVLVFGLAAAIYFGFFYNKEPEPVTTTVATTESTTAAPVKLVNPLTGEKDFNTKAIGKRPIAVVVENEFGSNDYAQQSRPQWGLDKADMVMEGEIEFATRLLLFWADYTDVAEKVGPARSARPPFIRFAEKFDAIFIHAGLSHSKGDYIGADTVFKNNGTDHVNLLEYSDGKYSGNDRSRPTIEHQHFFKGESAPDLIKLNKFRTKAKEARYTNFAFNDKVEDLSENKANVVKIKWSDNAGKRGTFTYDKKKGQYTTTDFNSKYGTVEPYFENIIVLADNTKYIVKENYKGSGRSETYCDYALDGGKGMVASNGTYVDITWEIKDKKIVLTKTDGTEVKLNPGKVYIAYISANHNGSFSAEAEAANE